MYMASELPELRFTAVVLVERFASEDATKHAAAAVGEEAEADSELGHVSFACLLLALDAVKT
jgi:hypothetical protein